MTGLSQETDKTLCLSRFAVKPTRFVFFCLPWRRQRFWVEVRWMFLLCKQSEKIRLMCLLLFRAGRWEPFFSLSPLLSPKIDPSRLNDV